MKIKRLINSISKKKICNFVLFLFLITSSFQAQFVHPGLTNKKSDLDRVKYMVESQIDPWYTSYKEMISDSKASYNYNVRGKQSFTELGRDDGTNYAAWNDDIRAAYYNAIQWYVTGDKRHADKSVEIFNTWKNLQNVTSGGTQALSGAIVYIMIEAAEIIKSTYSGWSTDDIQDFKDMLVYPGYSTSAEPDGISRTSGSFYWQAYQGDSVRHGNQGLSGFRAVMAMGIFMDNEIMYDRALRYIQGLPHRPDDIAYPSGPPKATTISNVGDYEDTYNYTVGTSTPDFGYNEVMTNYIYENGQCQESSRDQQHTFFGIGNLCAMAEMAWNQGDDLYSHVNDRLLLGLEYTAKYNVSYLKSYPDQLTHWIPTVESGEFIQRFNASQRVFAKFISPTHVGGYLETRPILEMPLAHYRGRGFKTENEVLWTTRARDAAIDNNGYEAAGHQNGAIGWGALTSRRPEGCYGEPISGFDSNGLPIYAMNVLPMTIEAENFDYSPVNGEGRTYHDTTNSNTKNEYRTDENVDIEIRTGGGYNITNIQNEEWLSYTVHVPKGGLYNIAINYSGITEGGTLSVSFDGVNKTEAVALPLDGGDLTLVSNINLNKGVQSMKILVGGTSNAFNLNNITVSIVNKINQTISSFDALPNNTEVGDDNINLYATASSGLPVTYTSSDDNVVSISNNEIQINGAGNVTITASQEGNDGFNAAPDIIQEFQVSLEGSVIRIEAEDFFAMKGVEIEDTKDVDGVSNVGFIDDGDYMDYIVNVPFSGNYIINYRVASKRNNNSVEFIADGISKVTTDNIPNTGNWQVFTTITTASISLTAGIQTIKLNIVKGGWNINWFELAFQDTLSTSTVDDELGLSLYPNPTNSIVNINTNNLTNLEVTIYDLNGRLLLKTTNSRIDISKLEAGLYVFRVKTDEGQLVKRILKN